MAECRVGGGGGGGDGLIKLFGKTIPVPPEVATAAAVGEADKVGVSEHLFLFSVQFDATGGSSSM